MKRFLACIWVIIVLTSVLTSCGTKKEDLVGTWTSDVFESDSGYTAVFIIEFDEDGTYTEMKCKVPGYKPVETETGAYEISNNKIRCIRGNKTTNFEYKDGTLTSGKRVYNKQ